MFKNPFSFKGRIRRTEYALSYVLAICLVFVWSFFLSYIEESGLKTLILVFSFYWFTLAQSAKRCHDMGQSGFYQLIPFYGIALLFMEGEPRTNQYGENPKNTILTQESTKNNYTFWPIVLPENKT